MGPVEVGLLGIVAMLVLFLLRMPVAFAMALVGMLGFAYLSSWSSGIGILSRNFYYEFFSYPLSAITLFVLMGAFALVAGIGERVYKAAYALVGGFRGGLAMATIMGCAAFAAICGSTSATVATMGKISMPEMKKYGYSEVLNAGATAAGGTLGILIPPSTVLIVYGYLTEQSIGRLFVAGIIPGIILALLYVLTIYILCRIKPALGPRGEPMSGREKLRSTVGILEAFALFVMVIGGLLLGWFSPTQAGAIGAAGALIIGLIRRQISWGNLMIATRDGLRTAAMILCLIAGATVFGRFLAISTIPFLLADWVEALPLSPSAIMVVIILIFFVGGFFMDEMAMLVLLIPVIFPVVVRLGFDPIWFGIITVLWVGLGVLTPPVGVNVYVVKAIAPEVSLQSIFKGIFPFLIAIFITIWLLIVFPQLILFVPELLGP